MTEDEVDDYYWSAAGNRSRQLCPDTERVPHLSMYNKQKKILTRFPLKLKIPFFFANLTLNESTDLSPETCHKIRI